MADRAREAGPLPDHHDASRSDAPRPPGRWQGPRTRSVLLALVLTPTIGLLLVATMNARGALSIRDTARQVQHQVDELTELAAMRVAIGDEQTQSAVLAVAADLDTDADALVEFSGVDYPAKLEAAREAVDATAAVSTPELRNDLDAVEALRRRIDEGEATFDDSSEIFDAVLEDLDALWVEHVEALRSTLGRETLSGSLHERSANLHDAFEALRWGSQRAGLAVRVLLGNAGAEASAAFLEATGRFEMATERLETRPGTEATEVWLVHAADPATLRFTATLDETALALGAGTIPAFATDPASFGEAFVDGEPWAVGLSEVTRAAARDLRQEATQQERVATRELWSNVGLAAALAAAALAAALFAARSIRRPVERLASAAVQIEKGRFDLERLPTRGPHELARTAAAFNEMAGTLARVEAQAIALSEDPDGPALAEHLPGPVGEALQHALDRLHASIRTADRYRQELEVRATHDGLTGLLNRSAALSMIERDLARAEREGTSVAVLFVDLDGLKAINDDQGHAAGDEAIRQTADALRTTTRDADVVARIGGDEFLVITLERDPSSLVGLAERIRSAIAARAVRHDGGETALRCSIGIARSRDVDETVDDLVGRADAALYRAKRQGKDRVVTEDLGEVELAGS